jgi:DNA polymerase-3 subunit delta
LDYKTAAKQISGGNALPMYICYGAEHYFREEFISFLISKTIEPEYRDFAVSKFDLAETPLAAVLEDAGTPPFLANRKIVIARNAIFLTGAKDSGKVEHKTELLQQYIQSPYEDSVLVLTVDADKLDERKKLVKLLKEQQATVEFAVPNETEMVRWVERKAAELKFRFLPGAVDRLILNTGAKLQSLSVELEKLSLFAGPGGEVSLEQVESLVARNAEQNVFLLVEEAVNRRLDRAYAILQDLIKQKEEPIKILFLLARQFRIILQVKELSRQGHSPAQIAPLAGIHPYAAKLALEHARKYELKQLCDVIGQLAELDFQMKTGAIDKLFALEMFLLKMRV